MYCNKLQQYFSIVDHNNTLEVKNSVLKRCHWENWKEQWP